MKLKFMGKKDFDLNNFSYNLEKKGNEIKTDNYRSIKIITYIIVILIDILLSFLIMYNKSINEESVKILIGLFLGFLSLPIHELFHAMWYREETYMYMDFIRGRAFVISKEVINKGKYIFISLFPNFILVFFPLLIGFIFKNIYLYFFGIYNTIIGVYDYINVYYVLKEVPNNAKIYLNKNGGFWF